MTDLRNAGAGCVRGEGGDVEPSQSSKANRQEDVDEVVEDVGACPCEGVRV